MRLPKLPIRRDTDDFDDAPEPAEQHPAPTPGTAATAGYRQVALPNLPPPPLSADLAKSIRFTISQPQGYYFEQVETFVKQVIETLAYHEQAEYAWQQAAYELQIELDQQAYDLQRVRSEIELFKVQGSPLVNPDGSYVTESQQATAETLMADLTAANQSLAAAQAALAQRDAEVARLQDLTSAKDQEITSLRQWGEQVLADAQSLHAQVSALSAAEGSQSPEQHDEVAPEVAALAPEVGSDGPDGTTDSAGATAALVAGVPVVGLPGFAVDSEDGFEGEDYDADLDDDHGDSHGDADTRAETSGYVERDGGHDEAAPDAYPGEEPIVESDEDQPDALAPSPIDEQPQVEYAAEPQTGASVPDEQDYGDTDAAQDSAEVIAEADPQVGSVMVPEPVEAPTYEDPHPETVIQPEAETPAEEIDEDQSEPEATDDGDRPAPDDEFDPYAEFDRAVSEDPSAPSYAIVPVDSELPEGVTLPGTGEAVVSYPPAAPDIPLDTRGVPVEVWAPELNPDLLNAAIEGDRARDAEPDSEAEAEDEATEADLSHP